MTPGPLLAIAVLGLAMSMVVGPKYRRAWLALTLAGAVALGAASLLVLTGAAEWELRSTTFRIGGELIYLRLDALSALFLMLVGLIGGTGAVYATGYWSDEHYPRSAPRGRAWWSGLVLSLGTVLLVSNGLGGVYYLRVFSRDVGKSATRGARGGLAVLGGVACRHGFSLRFFLHAGG